MLGGRGCRLGLLCRRRRIYVVSRYPMSQKRDMGHPALDIRSGIKKCRCLRSCILTPAELDRAFLFSADAVAQAKRQSGSVAGR